jgi:hypothetical protein
MMERLLAKIDANQAKTEATLKELKADQEHLKEKIISGQELLKEEMLASLFFFLTFFNFVNGYIEFGRKLGKIN